MTVGNHMLFLRINIEDQARTSTVNRYPANPIIGISLLPWGQQIGRATMGDYRERKPMNVLEEK